MERSIFAALIGGLLGITALGGMALVGSTPGSTATPSSRPESDWRRLDPVTYENISVFPVVSSYGQDTSPFLTLEEGLSTGEVIVSEQGSEGLVRSRDGRRIYFTNSLYAPWDAQFYPEGIRSWMVKLNARPEGGMDLDPNFFLEFGDLRGHQVRLEGGDASSDSYCYA